MNFKPIRASLLVAVTMFGCAREAPDAPPQVRYGQDECAQCGMIVSDERHAAVLRVVDEGRSRDLVFDDIGDMLAYERENKPARVARRYVHDFKTRQWLDAATAQFVLADGLHTPMGSGIVAFADGASADAQNALTPGRRLDLHALAADHSDGGDSPKSSGM